MADRRLGEVELLGRAGHAALAVDRLENHQQIEIEFSDIRHVYGKLRQVFIFVMV
jgi:hypothetical protein